MIIHADILTFCEAYEGEPFHALLCDPPYHLTETTKRFGKEGSAPPKGDVYARAARGFMGRDWDGGDIAFRPETWAALAKLLYPGAFLFAFAGTRGYHRMACAIEDAGLIIHPAVGWTFSTGFPKATRIDTQVDRRAGVERTKVGTKKHQPKFAAKDFGYREKDNGYNSKERESFDVTAPATELAQAWEGHRYGGQVLKPAFEFICVAQVPYQGRPIDCITRTGAGAININGGRIGRAADDRFEYGVDGDETAVNSVYSVFPPHPYNPHDVGRWPANLILQHSPACNGVCAPDCPAYRLGEQSGESESKRSDRGNPRIFHEVYKGSEGWVGDNHIGGHDDAGTAARFFFQADYLLDRLEQADPVAYFPKSSRSEREAGLDPRQIALLGKEEQETWDDQGQSRNTLAETDIPHQRATIESSGMDDSSLPMLCDGCRSSAQSQTATKSTTKTATNKTTESKTLNLSTLSPTSGSTADANSEMASGGNRARCAVCSSLLLPNIGIPPEREAHYTAGAAHAISETLSRASNSAVPPVGTINDGREKAIDNPYQRGKTPRRNTHATIKPLSLCRYLATLLLPPDVYAPRRLLIPFAGAGSEMIGAELAGWEEVVGVELEADHVRIAEARLAYWKQRRHEFGDPSKTIRAQLSEAPDGQLDMFGGAE